MFSYADYRRWRRRRLRRRALLATAVVALALITSQHARLHPTATSAHSARRSSHAGHRRAGATRPAVDQPASGGAAAKGAAGTGLSWVGFHGIALPLSRQDGPRQVRGGLAWGFTDTPRGALLAAVNIGVRTAALWGPRVFVPTIHRQVTGPSKAALLKADASDYRALRAAAHVRHGRPAGRGYAAEAAYRFIAYTPSAATVDVVTEGPAPSGQTVFAATRIQMLWRGGDWRVVAPPGGDWANSATTVPSLADYTPFTHSR